MSFCVVHFLNEDEVEVVPKSWIMGDRCYWPPYKNPERAIKSSESPSEEWNSYIIRILYERDTYEEARRKLKLAENASDLDNTTSSEKERGRGKRKRIPVNYSSESEVENDVHLDEQNIQCKMPPSLPMSCNSKSLDNEGINDSFSTAGSDENESSQQLVHSSRKCDRQKLRKCGTTMVLPVPEKSGCGNCETNSGF